MCPPGQGGGSAERGQVRTGGVKITQKSADILYGWPLMMVQTYFFSTGIPGNFDPEKGGYLEIWEKISKKNLEKKRGLRGIEINMIYMYIYTL